MLIVDEVHILYHVSDVIRLWKFSSGIPFTHWRAAKSFVGGLGRIIQGTNSCTLDGIVEYNPAVA